MKKIKSRGAYIKASSTMCEAAVKQDANDRLRLISDHIDFLLELEKDLSSSDITELIEGLSCINDQTLAGL